MKNTLLLSLLLHTFSLALQAQHFEHYYDSGQQAEDLCFSATALSDDRIAVAAFRRIANGSSSQSVLFFTDAQGNLDTLMLGPANRRNSSRWIQEISNDRLLLTTALAPTLNSRAEDWSFTIFDNTYNTIDRKSFGTPGNDEQIRDVIVLDNGNIAVCGEFGDGSRTLITLFDENLNFIWRQSLVSPGSGRLLYTSVQTTDDGFVIGGHEIPSGNTLSQAIMARYSSDGDLLWSNQYTNPNEFSPHGSEVFTVGENYLMLDEVQRDGKMMLSMLTIDPDGAVVSYGYFDGPETSRMQDAIQLPDGSFMLVGYTEDATDKRRGMIARLTAEGGTIWAREYERDESLTFSSISPRQGGSGGFLIGGYGEVCGRNDSDVVLLTVDDEGLDESECNVSSFDLNWTPAAITGRPLGSAADYSDQDGLLLDLMGGTGSRTSFFCPVFHPDPDQSSGSQSPLIYTVPESCALDSIAVVDRDAFFVSTGILDSFVINLVSPFSEDQLLLTGNTTSVISGNGTQRITIIGPISTDEVAELLQLIIVNDPTESVGDRTLEMTAFAGCEVSPVAQGLYRVTGQETANSTLPDTLVFCPGQDVTLRTGLSNTFLINWSTGDEGDSLVVSDPGTYTFVAINDCSEVIDSVVVVEQQGELAPFNDRSFALCLGDTIILDASTINATGYSWEDSADFGAVRPFFEAGNYLLTATSACDTANYTVVVTSEETANLTLPDTLVFCRGEDVRLQTGLSNTFLINWSTGDEGDSLVVSDPGTYSFVAINNCSEVIDSVVVEQQDQLLPFNNRRLALCLGDTITLDASVINADAYTWEDNQGFRAARPFFEAGTYLLTATNTCDTAGYQVIVTTENCCEIYIPNAFSPNADGINDQFRPESRAATCNLISGWSLRVYDRWGGEVFATNLFGTGWDGRRNGEALDPGVYAYVLEYFDGLNQRKEYGDITLLR